MRLAHRALALCLSLGLLSAPALAQQFPKYDGHVNDFANILGSDLESELEQLLRDVEKDTTAEIAVATVQSLDGMSVEEYANRLFKEWGVGQEKLDNGVLVLVAPTEREMRIEVGYGLEGVLPDGLAGEIIRTNFLPRFRDNDYPGGIEQGVERVVAIVRRNHVLTPEERQALAQPAADVPPMWLMIPFFGLFIAIGFFMLGLGVGSKTGFPVLFGCFFGGMPFLMSLVPFFNASVWVLGPLAIVMTVVGYRSGRKKPAWVREMRSTSPKGSGGGWVMGANSTSSGGSGSSSSSSSSGSSSSSSFGGGSSGGGGASGRW